MNRGVYSNCHVSRWRRGNVDVDFRELAPSFAPFRSYTGKISTCIRGVSTVAS